MAQHEALAQELYHLFATRTAAAGLKPHDPEIATILASMMAAHYVARGGSQKVFTRILDEVHRSCNLADALAQAGKHLR